MLKSGFTKLLGTGIPHAQPFRTSVLRFFRYSGCVPGEFGTEDEDETGERRIYNEKSVNSVTLLGRVGVEPQLRGTDSHPVVSFSLATTVKFKPGGKDSDSDLVSKTEWHNVAVFKPKLRESVHDFVTKGNRVMVQGRIMYGSVEDKMGNYRPTTTIVADEVIRFS